MRFSRLVALVASVACIALPTARASSPNFSGTVLQGDGTPVAGVHLRLRNVADGPIVGQTVSDKNGAFSFDVSEPGLYMVEAVDGDDVRTVSRPVLFTDSPITTDVMLPELNVRANFFSNSASFTSAVPLLAAAAGVGIYAWTISQGAALSPER